MATADAHAPAPNYYGSKAKKNTLGSRKILAIAGIILGLTIFAMAVSIIDDGFHIVSSSIAFKNEATAYQLSMQVAACSTFSATPGCVLCSSIPGLKACGFAAMYMFYVLCTTYT